MTEVLPIDVDLEFTVTRLAKIANTSHLSVYGGTLVRLGEFVRGSNMASNGFSSDSAAPPIMTFSFSKERFYLSCGPANNEGPVRESGDVLFSDAESPKPRR